MDDGKQTKTRALESVDIDYQNNLRSIYNVVIGDELDSPLFKAMKIPGKSSEEAATVPDRTTENSEEID